MIRPNLTHAILFVSLVLLTSTFGCSTSPTDSIRDPSEQYTTDVTDVKDPRLDFSARVIHPTGLDIQEIRSIFGPGAPSLESLKKCDFDYQIEKMLTKSTEQLLTTVPQYVQDQPETYHWCFYSKILELEEELLKTDRYVDEKQALILDRYPFFVYIARIYKADFNDPRYLEFAAFHFKRLNRRYFLKNVVLGEKTGPSDFSKAEADAQIQKIKPILHAPWPEY